MLLRNKIIQQIRLEIQFEVPVAENNGFETK